MQTIGAYFDDAQHFKEVQDVTNLGCVKCDKDPECHRPPKFTNLGQLKSHYTKTHKLHLCDICLEGRKVFVCEQQLYSKADLERHQAGVSSADKDNELGAASFKGTAQPLRTRVSYRRNDSTIAPITNSTGVPSLGRASRGHEERSPVVLGGAWHYQGVRGLSYGAPVRRSYGTLLGLTGHREKKTMVDSDTDASAALACLSTLY
eukprot:9358041-Pyramimonas_sp.AAC.1